MSLPDPGTPDLNSIDGSSWPTYWPAKLSYISVHSEVRPEQSGSRYTCDADDVLAVPVLAAALTGGTMRAARVRAEKTLILIRTDLFNFPVLSTVRRFRADRCKPVMPGYGAHRHMRESPIASVRPQLRTPSWLNAREFRAAEFDKVACTPNLA